MKQGVAIRRIRIREKSGESSIRWSTINGKTDIRGISHTRPRHDRPRGEKVGKIRRHAARLPMDVPVEEFQVLEDFDRAHEREDAAKMTFRLRLMDEVVFACQLVGILEGKIYVWLVRKYSPHARPCGRI
jgi:hypothetical protein